MVNGIKKVFSDCLDIEPEVDLVQNDWYWAAISQVYYTLSGPQPQRVRLTSTINAFLGGPRLFLSFLGGEDPPSSLD